MKDKLGTSVFFEARDLGPVIEQTAWFEGGQEIYAISDLIQYQLEEGGTYVQHTRF